MFAVYTAYGPPSVVVEQMYTNGVQNYEMLTQASFSCFHAADHRTEANHKVLYYFKKLESRGLQCRSLTDKRSDWLLQLELIVPLSYCS